MTQQHKLVVTRHPALVTHLEEIGLLKEGEAEVLTHVEDPQEVEGKTVIGVLPMHLAALTHLYVNVPLHIPADMRGKELTIDQVREYVKPAEAYYVQRIS